MIWRYCFLCILGLSAGVAIGTAVLAVYAIFDFVSALRMYSTDLHFDSRLESAVLAGATFAAVFYLFKMTFEIPFLLLCAIGLAFGIFIGLLTASLSDVIGFIPIVRSKTHSRVSISLLVFFMAFGRSIGSLYFFLFR